MTALQEPLEAVANAFGGNALALIGAIAVGLMAQGIAFGRRNLLERLELVSSEFIYGEDVSSSADPMQAAIQMFMVSSKDFKDAAGAMTGIETGLLSLSEQFSTSFSELGEKLAELADRNGNELFDKTAANLETLRARMGDLVEAVEANGRVYAGLAPSLHYRAEETKAALGEMDRTNRQLAVAMEMLGSATTRTGDLITKADQSLVSVQEASLRIASAGERTESNVATLTATIAGVEPKVAGAELSLQRIADTATHSEQRLAKMWEEFAQRIEKQLTGQSRGSAPHAGTTGGQSAVAGVSPDQAGEMLKSLQQINKSLRELPSPPPPRPFTYLVAPITNLLIAGAIVYRLMHR
jgi:hypothetical protein